MSPLSLTNMIYRWRESQDLRFDLRFGLETFDPDVESDNQGLPEKLRPFAQFYAPTPVALFKRFVRRSNINPRDFAFVDLGAGKGRALLLAATAGFHPVLGIEIDPRLCEVAEQNLRKWDGRTGSRPVMVHGDARKTRFPPGNLFIFMFNPFTGALFESVAERLARLAAEPGRAVVIAYHNDVCSTALERTGVFRRVRMRRLHFWRPPTASFFYNEAAWRMRRFF